jgi:hypothetical protein
MAYALNLPSALAARGLKVETVPGWETRSAGTFNPKGAVCHWTAGPRGTTKRASLGICINGRPDLPGPLCNVYLDRNGVAVVVAAGRANHAGAGNWRGLAGNSALFGTEAEAADAADFTPAQRDAYPRVCAAYCDIGKFGADMVCGHYEYATPAGRKTDPRGYTMDDMRRRVAALLANPTIPALAQEDDLTPEQAKQLAAIHEKTVAQRLPLAGRPGGDTDDPYGHVLSADAAARQALAKVTALEKTVNAIAAALKVKA